MKTMSMTQPEQIRKPAFVLERSILSSAAFGRWFRHVWPKAQGDITRSDMASMFAADLNASNDFMVNHSRTMRRAGGVAL